jgi:hypothetical protein
MWQSQHALLPALVIVTAWATTACTPKLAALHAATAGATGCAGDTTGLSGPPHHLVLVEGTYLPGSEVVWDAGKPGAERVLPSGFFGGEMFSVPPDATPGPHAVAIRNAYGQSAALTFEVTAPLAPFGPPRIDHVTILDAQFSATDVTASLYLSGANFDVGSVVHAETSPTGASSQAKPLATAAHKGAHTNLFGVAPGELGYPICHVLSLVTLAGAQPAGALLKLIVRNLDGQESAPFVFTLPTTAATLDSDGDALLDSWETGGYDENGDGTIDADLSSLGARPYRRDILLELDVMSTVQYAPDAASLDAARAMFAAAPVLNPLDADGINLIVLPGAIASAADTVVFMPAGSGGPDSPDANGQVTFGSLKNQFFDHAKAGRIVHYGIWAHQMAGPLRSGRSDIDKFNTRWAGDDFLVSIDAFPKTYQTTRSQAEILVHELGHNLGQRHGGLRDDDFVANHSSVMSYSSAMRTSWSSDAVRVKYPTCGPLYYGQKGATEPNGTMPPSFGSVPAYSSGMTRTLDEQNLNELAGVCGPPVNWDGVNGLSPSVSGNVNVSASGAAVPGEIVSDFANWPALVFDGPALDGWLKP